MQTRLVPRTEWPAFLGRFSRVHLGHDVTVEVSGDYMNCRTVAAHLPLVGVVLERIPGRPDWLGVIVGERPSAHVAHGIDRPRQVQVAVRDGTEVALEIDGSDGTTTTITLAQPAAANTPPAFA